jgi:hypothetical protein
MNPWEKVIMPLEEILELLATLGFALVCEAFEDEKTGEWEFYWSYVKYEEDGTSVYISDGCGNLPDDPEKPHHLIVHGKYSEDGEEYPDLQSLVLCLQDEEEWWNGETGREFQFPFVSSARPGVEFKLAV